MQRLKFSILTTNLGYDVLGSVQAPSTAIEIFKKVVEVTDA